jgi:uncharacterized membrane protein
MSEVWITVAALAVATATIKAAGPIALGGRELPPRAMTVIALLAPALLAALVVVETFSDGKSLVLDARAAGIAAAAAVLSWRPSLPLAVIAAAVVAAAVRLVT